MQAHLSTCLVLISLFGSASRAAGQVLPPADPSAGKGDLSPHVDCVACTERSYTFPSNAPTDKEGNLLVWCTRCKKDTPHRSSVNTAAGLPTAPPRRDSRPGGLRLRAPEPPSAPPPANQAPVPAAPAQGAPPEPAAVGGAPAFVFGEVRRLKSVEDRLAEASVESLCAMGEVGLVAARNELGSMDAPVVLVAARVLLRGGQAADLARIEERLRSKLPAAAGGPLLAAFVRAEPARAGPRFLCEMLDSPHAGVRGQAARELRSEVRPDLIGLLEPALASRRAETRAEALGLVGAIDEARALDVLLAHLADPAPHVAARVVGELAGRREEGLDARLLALAFRERWILRTEAYALLALVEREDTTTRSILRDEHADALLAALSSNDPFVSGACACALAGIGFRSERTRSAPWLDQDVVDRLVGVVSGRVFHNDFAALQSPALRRLKLLTGQEAGSEGARWLEWWINARSGFHAHRAWIQYEPAELAHLRVRMRTPEADWLFLGPEQPSPTGRESVAQAYFLTLAEAGDLAAALKQEGVFGPEQLPGLRGAQGQIDRSLEVSIAGRSKGFQFGRGAEDAWLERVLAAGRSLADRNRWQQFPSPGRHASTRELWQEQSAWWSAEHTPRERDLRLKGLVLAALAERRGPQHERACAELQRLYANPGLEEAADFRFLLAELARGASSGPTIELIRMAIASARSVDPQRGLVPIDAARELLRTVLGRGDPGRETVAAVLEAAGPAFTREMLADPRPLVRAAAVRVLVRLPEAEAAALLLPLLSDKAQEVEAAAVESLGELRVESARTELLVRARLGLKPVRQAALRAAGRLGGDYVLDALLLALSDGDADLRLAAVEGLGELEDAVSAPFLVSHLCLADDPRTADAARAGLLRLRERAWPELRRALLSNSPPARLEAALVLAQQCVADAAPVLLVALTTNPRDTRIAGELCVLSCVDFRGQQDPAEAWWNWWEGVVHEDSLPWFRAALERLKLQPPPSETFAGRGSRETRAFLLQICGRDEPWLAERARRMLAQALGQDLGALPPQGAARQSWIAGLSAKLDQLRDP